MQHDYEGMVTALVKAMRESNFLLSVTDKKVKKALKKMDEAIQHSEEYLASIERYRSDPQVPDDPVPDPDHPEIWLNTRPPEEKPNVPHCHSSRDGDCFWKHCPQDKHYQSYCPYAKAWEEHWKATGGDY
ncbi:hypothetical protein EVC24_018 [Rhizobium phage RHph_I4]|nr:hypothetical protein EVC24_018 [Rhizobium phage RHph_I4]